MTVIQKFCFTINVRFDDDINDEYSPSDSDDDYTQEEKDLLKKHQRQDDASDSEVHANQLL